MLQTVILALAVTVMVAHPVHAVSVLSHEEMIDVTWEADILPLLKARFPDATPEQLKRAHAFAYGGSVIQDVGYYPLGNKSFTDLLHYVRSGDFIVFLIREARDVNEYAFALGALSHYAADCWGHKSVNVSEPILYPKLVRKFGKVITYEDDPQAHLRTEFSFDVLEVAQFGNKYRRPGVFARILGFLIKLVPFGPTRILGYRNPTAQAEDNYFRSMNQAMDEYRKMLHEVKSGRLEIPNRNFDTGNFTRAGEYKLCDRSYAKLLHWVVKSHFQDINEGARANIVAFFAAGKPDSISDHDWKKVERDLMALKNYSEKSATRDSGQ